MNTGVPLLPPGGASHTPCHTQALQGKLKWEGEQREHKKKTHNNQDKLNWAQFPESIVSLSGSLSVMSYDHQTVFTQFPESIVA